MNDAEKPVTTEDDFQRNLDDNPENWTLRTVFADWLQDHGDTRAEGYRAIARQKRLPLRMESHGRDAWWWYRGNSPFHNNIPDDWFALLPAGPGSELFWPLLTRKENVRSRRQCEDELARAFAELSETRRQQLLTPPE
jgi:uncharacterized protein (TIGR02996 family)